MGLFSSIQEAFNSDIVYKFNNLYDNYYRGAEFFYKVAMKSPSPIGAYNSYLGNEPFSRNIDYNKKKILVEYENEVKDIDKDFVQEDHKQEIIAMAQKFPRAYLFYCKKNGISESSLYTVPADKYVIMPGQTTFVSFSSSKRRTSSLTSVTPSAKSTAIFYDSHFESLINKELDGYPRFQSFGSNIPGITSVRLSGIINQYGGVLNKYQALMHGLSITGSSVSVTFKENKGVTVLYPLISQFEAKEKEIDTMVKREHLWYIFEKNIILNPYGAKYYKAFFSHKYGTEYVPISAYEELAKDPTPLNDYISKQEEVYRRLKRDCPNGVAQFEKTHPQVPHSEYGSYERDIQKLEVQSKYVKYPENQGDLSKAIMTKLPGKTSWSFEQLSIRCNVESYDRQPRFSSCSMVFASHQLLYDKALDGSLEPNAYIKYPHCKEILDAESLNSMTSASLLGILTEVLIPMIDSYLGIFKPVCVVLDEMVEGVLETGSIKKAPSILLDALFKIKKYPGSDVQVTTSDLFRLNHPDHIPYIFVEMLNSSELATRKLSELADGYLLSSIVSVIKVVNGTQINEIESSRRKDEEDTKRRKIQEIRRDNPYGFERFCSHHGLSEDSFVLRYGFILDSLGEIRQIQRAEDDRKREEARRQHEAAIINRARSIISSYPNVAKEKGYTSSSSLDYASAQTILSQESSWKEIEQLFYGRFSLFGVTKNVSGLPHKFFFEYYPSNKYHDSELSKEQISNRSFVWGFKDGKDYYQSKAIEMVSEFINSSGLKRYANKLVLVCSPASNNISNANRFRFFSEEVCNKTGIDNGFDHINLTGIAVPKHRGGSGCVEFEAERSFFSGRYVVLFDDLVTSGGTVYSTKRKLEEAGARVIGIISLGQTKSSW